MSNHRIWETKCDFFKRSYNHKMKLLLLSGNSISNKKWIEEVGQILNPLFDEIKIHYYKHWETGEEIIDLDSELSTLTAEINEWKDYMIFAKSAGCLLTLKGIYEKKIHPLKCVFVGAAIDWGKERQFLVGDWLKNYNTTTFFIQKTNDPVISFKNLKKILEDLDVKNYSLKEIPGNDHNYLDLEFLRQVIENFK